MRAVRGVRRDAEGSPLDLLRRDLGASSVELAIVLTVLLLMLFGTIQFGIVYNQVQGLQAGAREGGRLASLPQSTVGHIKDRVRATVSAVNADPGGENCSTTLASGQYCITISSPAASSPSAGAASGCTSSSTSHACTFQPCNLQSGRAVTVEVAYGGQLDIPLWRLTHLTLRGRGVFRCE